METFWLSLARACALAYARSRDPRDLNIDYDCVEGSYRACGDRVDHAVAAVQSHYDGSYRPWTPLSSEVDALIEVYLDSWYDTLDEDSPIFS